MERLFRVSDQFITCRDCGKDMPAGANICPECGAQRHLTRHSREEAARAVEPEGSQVVKLTDALDPLSRKKRSIKHTPEATFGRRLKSKRKTILSHSRVNDEIRLHDDDSDAEVGTADDDELQPVRRTSKRKVYRYEKTKKTNSNVMRDAKAILILIAIALCLLLMCRIQGASAEPATATQIIHTLDG